MKRVLLFITCSVASLGMFAQSLVSTTPSNRNVLLEDLTGIKCGYCPDGALKADQLKQAAPDRVVLIGNHCSSYANPSSGQPGHLDLRTTQGAAVNSNSMMPGTVKAGYPAGNLNRSTHNAAYDVGWTATSRSQWASVASAIMDMPSAVNIGVEAYYNPGSNKIQVNVEAYYTSNGTGNDYLTVAVLQDEIDTYQSGASGYPARIQPSGFYRQMDVLRTYLTTPTFGEMVSPTTATTLYKWNKEYTAVQVGPDVQVDVSKMHIAVWLSEDAGWSEVITATVAAVEERPVGINEASSLNDLNIYPNPFQSNATIDFNLDKSQQIAVDFYDVTGKVVQSVPSTVYNVGNHKINLDGNNLQGGIYYVNIVAEDGIITRKVVLNK